jgi:hypothetical protein
MVDAHVVNAVASDHQLAIDVPAGTSELRFHLVAVDIPIVSGTGVIAAGMHVDFGQHIERVSLAGIGTDAYEIRAVSKMPAGGITAEIRFAETPSHPTRV